MPFDTTADSDGHVPSARRGHDDGRWRFFDGYRISLNAPTNLWGWAFNSSQNTRLLEAR